MYDLIIIGGGLFAYCFVIVQPQDAGFGAAPVGLHGVQAFARGGMVGVQRTQADKQGGDDGLGGAGIAVGDLHGDAALLIRQDGDKDGFGPGLDRLVKVV